MVKPRIPTVPMSRILGDDYKKSTQENKDSSVKSSTTTSTTQSRPVFLEPIYIPKPKQEIVQHVVIANPCFSNQLPVAQPIARVVPTIEGKVFLPVAGPAIGFLPVVGQGFVQVQNPVICVVQTGPTVTPLPRIVPNLVKF